LILEDVAFSCYACASLRSTKTLEIIHRRSRFHHTISIFEDTG
jgi:hypothetical protein